MQVVVVDGIKARCSRRSRARRSVVKKVAVAVDCGCMRSRSRRTELEELQLQLQLKKKVVYGISSSSSSSDANNKRILNFNQDTLGYTDNFDDGKWQQGLL